MEACTTYETSDGAAESTLAHAAARRFEQDDGRPARFRAEVQSPHAVRLTGSVRVRPPFGVIGPEIHVGHAVILDLSGTTQAKPAPAKGAVDTPTRQALDARP